MRRRGGRFGGNGGEDWGLAMKAIIVVGRDEPASLRAGF